VTFIRIDQARWLIAAFGALALPDYGRAQEAGAHDADELAKQLSNPVAALISVPLQFNYDAGFGVDGDGERWQLNVQPVMPVGITDEVNMISRTILPVIDQSEVISPGSSESGIGDITQSLFFSRKQPRANGWIIGVGPVFLLPTATEDELGSEKWGIGPTVVLLKQTESSWTYGALVNHIWSVAGDEDRAEVNSTFLQPFLTRALGHGRSVTLNFESSYDWEREQWTVPLNLTYSKVTQVGGQQMSFAIGGRTYLETPDGGPDWGARFVVTLLYPKK
jgi:hypothetical protein